MRRAIQMSLLLPLWLLFGCIDLTGLKCDLGGTGPECPTTTYVPKACSELVASQFSWSLRGFLEKDILNPDVRDQRELTAIMHVGFTENPRTASLIALQPGDTAVAAILHFQDGTPPLRVLPWSFTHVGSGNVTVVRVVP